MTDYRTTRTLLSNIGSSIKTRDSYERSEYYDASLDCNLRTSLLKRIWDASIFGDFPLVGDQTESESILKDGAAIASIYFADIVKAALDLDYGLNELSEQSFRILNERIGSTDIENANRGIRYHNGKYYLSYHRPIHNISDYTRINDYRLYIFSLLIPGLYNTQAQDFPMYNTGSSGSWEAIRPTWTSWGIECLTHDNVTGTITFEIPTDSVDMYNLFSDGSLCGFYVSEVAVNGIDNTRIITTYTVNMVTPAIGTIVYDIGSAALDFSPGDYFYLGKHVTEISVESIAYSDLTLQSSMWMYDAGNDFVTIESITDAINYIYQMLDRYTPTITALEESLDLTQWRGSKYSNTGLVDHYVFIRSQIVDVILPAITSINTLGGNQSPYPKFNNCRDNLPSGAYPFQHIPPTDPVLDDIGYNDGSLSAPFYASAQDSYLPNGLYGFLTNLYRGFGQIYGLLFGSEILSRSSISSGLYQFDSLYYKFKISGYISENIGNNAGLYSKLKDIIRFGYINEFSRISFIDTLLILAERCKSVLALNTFTNVNLNDSSLLADRLSITAQALQNLYDSATDILSVSSDVETAMSIVGVPYDTNRPRPNSLIAKLNNIIAKLRYSTIVGFGYNVDNDIELSSLNNTVGVSAGTVTPLSRPVFIDWGNTRIAITSWAPRYEYDYIPLHNRTIDLFTADVNSVGSVAMFNATDDELAVVAYDNVDNLGFGSRSGDFNGLFLKETRGTEQITRLYKIVDHYIWNNNGSKRGYLYINPGYSRSFDFTPESDYPLVTSTFVVCTTYPYQFLRSDKFATPVAHVPQISKNLRIFPLNYNGWSEFNDRASHHVYNHGGTDTVDPYITDVGLLQNNSIAINNACLVFNLPSRGPSGDFNMQLLNMYFDQRNLLPLNNHFMVPSEAGLLDYCGVSVWKASTIPVPDANTTWHDIRPYGTQASTATDSYYYSSYFQNGLIEILDSDGNFTTSSILISKWGDDLEKLYFSPVVAKNANTGATDKFRVYDSRCLLRPSYLPGNVNVRVSSDNQSAGDQVLTNYPIFSVDHACVIPNVVNSGYVRSHTPAGEAVASIIISNGLIYMASISINDTIESSVSINKIINPNLYVQPRHCMIAIAPDRPGVFDSNLTTGGELTWDATQCRFYLIVSDDNNGDPLVRFIDIGSVYDICNYAYDIVPRSIANIKLTNSIEEDSSGYSFVGLDHTGSSIPILFYDMLRGKRPNGLDDSNSFRILAMIKNNMPGEDMDVNIRLLSSTRTNPFKFSEITIDASYSTGIITNINPTSFCANKTEIWHAVDGIAGEATIGGTLNYMASTTLVTSAPLGTVNDQLNGKLALLGGKLMLITDSVVGTPNITITNVDPSITTATWAVPASKDIIVLRDFRHYVAPTHYVNSADATNNKSVIMFNTMHATNPVIKGNDVGGGNPLTTLFPTGYIGRAADSLAGCLLAIIRNDGLTSSHLITANTAISGATATLTVYPAIVTATFTAANSVAIIYATAHDCPYNYGRSIVLDNSSEVYPSQLVTFAQQDFYFSSGQDVYRLHPVNSRFTTVQDNDNYFDSTTDGYHKYTMDLCDPNIIHQSLVALDCHNMFICRSSADVSTRITANSPMLFVYGSYSSNIYELPVFSTINSYLFTNITPLHDVVLAVAHDSPASNYPKLYDGNLINHPIRGITDDYNDNTMYDIFKIVASETHEQRIKNIEDEVNILTGGVYDRSKIASIRKGLAALSTKRFNYNEVDVSYATHYTTYTGSFAGNGYFGLNDSASSPFGVMSVASIAGMMADYNINHGQTTLSKSGGTIKQTSGNASFDRWNFLFVKKDLSELFK